jgi:HEPN domain-containing protein
MPPENRSRDWLRQAENDLEWAADTLKSGRFAQACFVCQQAAEKAMKSIAFARGADKVKGHSILAVARALGVNAEVEAAARKLDLYYITTRYPDALPAGAPFEFFAHDQAKEALDLAELILARAREELGHG